RYVITSWLRRDGHRVIEAATGLEALRLMHGGPDGAPLHAELVVLDVRLPDIDCFEVAERIKEDPRTTAIPVIHISATAVPAVQVDEVDGEPQVRPAMREPYELDPLDGQAGTLLFLQETGPWWPGAVWRVVARAKPGREPLHVAVPAEGFSADDADLLRQFGQ